MMRMIQKRIYGNERERCGAHPWIRRVGTRYLASLHLSIVTSFVGSWQYEPRVSRRGRLGASGVAGRRPERSQGGETPGRLRGRLLQELRLGFFSFGKKGTGRGCLWEERVGGRGWLVPRIIFILRINDKKFWIYVTICATIRVAGIIFIKFRLLHR